MKFSIIVPVYNIENYINECLDSIIKQKFKDYEVLLIDDGSTDNSGNICDQYSKLYDNFYVYHKVNGGLSSARNFGMELAKGDYLVFIDSDDYISQDALEKISECTLNSPDIIITRMIHEYIGKSEVRNNSIIEILNADNKECINWIFKISENTWPAPQYIVKRSFVKKNNLAFAEGYLHEDLDWTCRIFALDANISVCECPWYHHRLMREGSITTKSNPKRVLDVYYLSNLVLNDLNNMNLNNDIYILIYERIVSSLISILRQYKHCNIEEKKLIVEVIKQNIDLFANSKNYKVKLFKVLIALIGYKNTVALFSIYQNR